ncbi:cytochrome c oxidase assembly factor Coa1 family protein [Mitsuaria sp. 7]|uniref:cytochrome c oxidase assembly factor Coa1 family protein n=1 Tax=Mitsuaria sp. 7 TaxID=1658665 RepID=UPI0007DDD4F4|nr:cytochrome c oxidase assembly factor Coa1 family protein [Mitsuaria sp. 7]ANH66538.1 hypothetical protein ABE85_01325 [Mitsuaria sp. 7]
MDNTSGMGSSAAVPPEIDRWSWGAFLCSWIWGMRNNVWRALFVFVPFFGFFMWFALGAKGNAWAWQHRRWESVASFQAEQRAWAKWGAIIFIGGMLIAVLGSFFAAFSMMKNSEAYQLSVTELRSNADAMRLIGQPMETGFPMGSIQYSGPNGAAALSYSVEGPAGEGKVFVEATMSLGQWNIQRMVLQHGKDRLTILPKDCGNNCPH